MQFIPNTVTDPDEGPASPAAVAVPKDPDPSPRSDDSRFNVQCPSPCPVPHPLSALIQHPEVHSAPIVHELLKLIVDRKGVCSILSNGITGKVVEGLSESAAARGLRKG